MGGGTLAELAGTCLRDLEVELMESKVVVDKLAVRNVFSLW